MFAICMRHPFPFIYEEFKYQKRSIFNHQFQEINIIYSQFFLLLFSFFMVQKCLSNVTLGTLTALPALSCFPQDFPATHARTKPSWTPLLFQIIYNRMLYGNLSRDTVKVNLLNEMLKAFHVDFS